MTPEEKNLPIDSPEAAPDAPEIPEEPVIAPEVQPEEAAAVADDPAEEVPAEEPVEAPAEEPAEAPVETPAEEPAEVPAEIPVQFPIEAPAQIPVQAPPVQPVYQQPVYQQQVYQQPVYQQQVYQQPAQPVKQYQPRRKPHIAIRIPLQLLSLVLAIVIFAVGIVGVVLADLRQLISADGLKQIINSLLIPGKSAAVTQPIVRPGPIHAVDINSTSEGDFTVDEDGNITIGGGPNINIDDIPDDILGGGGTEENISSLVDWIYEQIEETSTQPLNFSQDDLQDFVADSTVSDYLAEKLSDYANDFINGTEEAEITVDEIMDLLDENEELLEDYLNVEMSREQRQQIKQNVTKLVEENDLNETLRDKVYVSVEQVLEESSGLLGGRDLQDIQNILKLITSDALFYGVVGVMAILLLLLMALNFYNVPAALTWAGIPCMIAGGIVSAPILLLKFSSDLVIDLLPGIGASLISTLVSFLDVFAPIHYGLAIIGFGLVVLSIIWRIIRGAIRRSRMAAV